MRRWLLVIAGLAGVAGALLLVAWPTSSVSDYGIEVQGDPPEVILEHAGGPGVASESGMRVLVVDDVAATPIPGAEVSRLRTEAGDSEVTLTDITGTAKLGRRDAGKELRVSHPQFLPAVATASATAFVDGVLKIGLKGRGTLKVSVRSKSAATPVTGARLVVAIPSFGTRSVQTPDAGDAVIESLPAPTSCTVSVQASGFLPQSKTISLEHVGELSFTLEPAVRLRVRVNAADLRDSQTAQQLMAALYVIDDPMSSPLLATVPVLLQRGSGSGELWVRSVPARVRASISALGLPGAWELEADVRRTDPGTEAECSFDLPPARVIVAQFRVAGHPGAETAIYFWTAGSVTSVLRTDKEGRSRVILPMGATTSDVLFWQARATSDWTAMSSGAADAPQVIELGLLGGYVAAPGWHPKMGKLTVEEVARGSAGLGEFIERPQGDPQIHVPPGRYRVCLNGAPVTDFNLTVVKAQTTTCQVFQYAQGEILGSTLAGVTVRLLVAGSAGERSTEMSRAVAGPKGAFSFAGLVPATYVVAVDLPSGGVATRVVSIRAGQQVDVGDIGASGLATLQLQVHGRNGVPRGGERLTLWSGQKNTGFRRVAQTDPEGRAQLEIQEESPLALFGAGWAVAMPARERSAVIAVPEPDDGGSGPLLRLREVQDRQVLWLGNLQPGPMFVTLLVRPDGHLPVLPAIAPKTYIYSSSGVCYSGPNDGPIEVPKPVLIPEKWIPATATSAIVRPVAVGPADISVLGWSWVEKIGSPPARELAVLVADEWTVEVTFPGSNTEPIRVLVDGGTARAIRPR